MATISEKTTVPFVDLGPSSSAVSQELLPEIAELIERGAFVNGPYLDRFEQDFAAYTNRQHTVGVASGLDALRLGLLACGIQPGDEVIVPAMTFIATFEAVIQAGGKPLVVDVNLDDANIDSEQTAAAITPNTRFLLPVHLYGQMSDCRTLQQLAQTHQLDLIEDACQAHGASRDGITAGNAGKAAAFSFYPSKNLGAMGDAGALVLDDPHTAATLRALREHGQTRRYHSDHLGYTARLDALQALILTHKLPHLTTWNNERRQAADYYTHHLTNTGDLQLPTTHPNTTHVWHLYTIRTQNPTALAEHLQHHGIATGRHYPQPPHLAPALKHLNHPPGSFPNAETIANQTLSLPLYPGITEHQQETVTTTINNYFTHA